MESSLSARNDIWMSCTKRRSCLALQLRFTFLNQNQRKKARPFMIEVHGSTWTILGKTSSQTLITSWVNSCVMWFLLISLECAVWCVSLSFSMMWRYLQAMRRIGCLDAVRYRPGILMRWHFSPYFKSFNFFWIWNIIYASFDSFKAKITGNRLLRCFVELKKNTKLMRMLLLFFVGNQKDQYLKKICEICVTKNGQFVTNN